MKRKDKKLYEKIIKIYHREWLKDHTIYSEDYNRYTLDLEQGFLMFFPASGKILLKTPKGDKTVFRNTDTALMLTSDIQEIINQLEK